MIYREEEHTMKVSNYNFFIKRGTGNKDYIAYNSRTNALALVSEEQFEAVKNFENTGKMIEDTDFLEELKIGGFVINTEINELEQIKFKMLRQRFRTDVLSLIIAPTSDCNFRCIYCYEKDSIKHPPMSLEVQDSIVDFVKQKSKTIKRLRVTWYGGEPMLCFEIIKKLSFEMIEICRENNIDYAAGIVTNGYFLTPENCKEFIDLKIMSMQITLDGDKEYHDSRRILKDGRGSFDKIIHNLQTIKGILPYKISIRINVDRENEKAIAHFLELLKKEEIHKAEETIRKEKDEEIAALQKQLFDMQTRQLSDQAALQEAKTALLSLRLELSQAHQKELNEVRIEKDKKIEALQNELLKAFDKK